MLTFQNKEGKNKTRKTQPGAFYFGRSHQRPFPPFTLGTLSHLSPTVTKKKQKKKQISAQSSHT